MKITFISGIPLDYWGGGEKWQVNVANALVDRGHDVEMKTLIFRLGDKRKLPVIPLNPKIRVSKGYMHTVKDSDLTYVMYHPLSGLSFHIKSGKRIAGIHSGYYLHPSYMTVEHRLSAEGLRLFISSGISGLLEKRELAKFDAVHDLYDYYKIKHDRVYFIPNFVDGSVYKPTGEKNERFTVGYSGRKIGIKGYDRFLELKKTMGDEVKFTETNNIPEYDMPFFYSRCSVMIIPHRSIPKLMQRSTSVIESMMCGTPVICFGKAPEEKLTLPINFCENVAQMVDTVRRIKRSADYPALSNQCRVAAMALDKKPTIDKLEKMFEDVYKI